MQRDALCLPGWGAAAVVGTDTRSGPGTGTGAQGSHRAKSRDSKLGRIALRVGWKEGVDRRVSEGVPFSTRLLGPSRWRRTRRKAHWTAGPSALRKTVIGLGIAGLSFKSFQHSVVVT